MFYGEFENRELGTLQQSETSSSFSFHSMLYNIPLNFVFSLPGERKPLHFL